MSIYLPTALLPVKMDPPLLKPSRLSLRDVLYLKVTLCA